MISSFKNTIRMENLNDTPLRRLEWWDIRRLESQGCTSADWENVFVAPDCDLSLIRNVRFSGRVRIGSLSRGPEGEWHGIENAVLHDCRIGDHVSIRNIGIAIRGYEIGNGTTVENVGLMEYEAEAPCGVGRQVSVLDETGSRPVTIYPGLSAQLAVLMARKPKWGEEYMKPLLDSFLETRLSPGRIGEGAVVVNTGEIRNVFVDREVRVEGASRLSDGSVINNAAPGKCLAGIGSGVRAHRFIVEDGVVDGGATLEGAYVGQGARIDKGFTAHDSLFFANCTCENGEGCALFAGPYTTTMHKSTLLIGALTHFMNAGSGTNQSNHLYKMGPVHWGILERGVKTSSGSYVMWGAKIGAFSLLVGNHKMHPDSSDFPFSYLFGDERGGTIVVPGIMLRSSGLLRDEKKWPLRERRARRKLHLHDRINFEVLNPVTVGAMARALPLISELRKRPADDDRYVRYKGLKLRVSNLERASRFYTLGICKYLHLKTGGAPFPESHEDIAEEWIDLAGQFVERSCMERVMASESVEEMERLLTESHERYPELERRWIAIALREWRDRTSEIEVGAAEFDRMMEEDRRGYLDSLAEENAMLAL